jgi:hypothetical protein
VGNIIIPFANRARITHSAKDRVATIYSLNKDLGKR